VDLTHHSANLAELASAAAGRDPQRLALIANSRRLTWAALDHRVSAFAAALTAGDLRLGDRVALLMGDAFEFVQCYLAALRAGLVVVPIDPGSTPAQVAATLVETGARLLIADEGTQAAASAGAAAVDADGAGARVVRAEVALNDAMAAPAQAGRQGRYGGEATAVLLATAGTGGAHKRAMLSHRALLANLSQCAALEPAPVIPADTVLLALPLFHIFGLNAVFGHALFAGATVVVAADPDPAATLAVIAGSGVTSVAGTPAMFAAWAALPQAREALSGVRVLVSGSAPLRPADAEAFRTATGQTVWQGYGLTEAAPVVSASMRARSGSVGVTLPGIEIRFLDPGGRPAAEGDPGELWIRGPNLFSGYWPDGAGGPDRDGWFATGDVGWAAAEGNLFMVNTRWDVVVVSGFPVYPHEVEDVAVAAPGVREAAAVGVADESTGQTVKLFVVLEPGAQLDAEAVQSWCAARLGRFKVPRHVEFVDALPRSVAGKIARGRLRAVAEGSGEGSR
jgi:long-chain acyl-CoA synthetase